MSCYCGEKTCPQCNHEIRKDFGKKKKSKSPLEGLMDHVEAMSPEEREKWQKDLAESMKKWRAEREAAEKKKNEPPKMPTGMCMICGGDVKGKHEKRWNPGNNRIGGPPAPGYWHFLGYHCTQCGLMYKFPPPKDVVMLHRHVKP